MYLVFTFKTLKQTLIVCIYDGAKCRSLVFQWTILNTDLISYYFKTILFLFQKICKLFYKKTFSIPTCYLAQRRVLCHFQNGSRFVYVSLVQQFQRELVDQN
jgi:hypothetical protein